MQARPLPVVVLGEGMTYVCIGGVLLIVVMLVLALLPAPKIF